MNAADGPSDAEEEEKDAKRQRSAPTTPRSTSSIVPHEYDEVMGITQVEPRDAERFEEGSDSDFQDAEEATIRETDTGEKAHTETVGPGKIHGDSAVPHYESVLRELSSRVRSPLLPSTLGKV